ncbi:MAG: DUF4129 domain-containing protein [Chloroflexota bacterium]
MLRVSAQATLGAVLVARCMLEGALFAAIVAAAQLSLGVAGRPVPVVAIALALTGVGIVLASVLRDARADRQNTAIAVIAIGAAATFGVLLRTPRADGLEILTRLVTFGIIGEVFVWRNLSVARGLVRWQATRNAAFAGIAALALTAVLPGTVDRSGLVLLGLATTAAAGIALSLARSAEELSLAGKDARGGVSRTTASGSAILLAVVAVIGAVFSPFLGDLLGRAGEQIAPVIGDLLFGVLLLFGYVAAFVVEVFRLLLSGLSFQQFRPPVPPTDAARDAEAIRQIEATRPFVLGAVELIIAAIAIILVVVLVDRMARERRETLPEGASLDRESTGGDSIGAFLAGLLPRRRRRPRAPHDDGTPAGTLRALYWRYLARGEIAGVAWRAPGETPAEHQERATRRGGPFAAASPLVRAFEDLRYGDRDPDAATIAAARAAVAAVEAPG